MVTIIKLPKPSRMCRAHGILFGGFPLVARQSGRAIVTPMAIWIFARPTPIRGKTRRRKARLWWVWFSWLVCFYSNGCCIV
jgi:hypothetical protein